MRNRFLCLTLALCILLSLMPAVGLNALAYEVTDQTDVGTVAECQTSGAAELPQAEDALMTDEAALQAESAVREDSAETRSADIRQSTEIRKSDTDIAYPVEGGNIYFDKETGTITGCDNTVTSANIPEQIDGVTVLHIGNYAFVNLISEACWTTNENLKYVTIPNSVTNVGEYAFSLCTNLASVTIGNSVTSIGDFAFDDCTSLTSITIPESVTSIGYYAFEDCTSLTSITIPESVTSIKWSFDGCTSLTGIWVDKNNLNYSSDAYGVLFNKKKTILIQAPVAISGEYTIPESVESIMGGAFNDCTNLTSVIIPDSVTAIGSSVFNNTSLYNDSGNWIDGVLYIGNWLIEADTSISGEYSIPDGIVGVARGAFYDCKNMVSIKIPDSVTNIGGFAFEYCESLTGIWVDKNNLNYSSDAYGVLFNKEKTELIQAPCAISGEYMIPDSVTSISDGAYEDCTSLTSITIPDSVTSIGDSAFNHCTNLSSVTIGNSVTGIGSWTFSSCESLTSVKIPDSVTYISTYAFQNCTNLTSVTIPDSVKYIEGYAFYNTSLYNNSDNWIEGILYIGNWLVATDTSISGDYSIPDGIVGIASRAFINCESLMSVSIPDSVIAIGEYAFYNTALYNNSANWTDGVLYIDNNWLIEANAYISGNCSIPNGIVSIADSAFEDCISLTSVTIPNSVTSIGSCAFYGCFGLTSVTIPESVTKINLAAFYDCVNLKNVYFLGNAPKTESREFQTYSYSTFTEENIPGLTLYFIDGKDGWTTPTWNGYPTKTWDGVKIPGSHEHNYTASVTKPTCTAKGYTTYTCSCGDSYKDNYKDALGHNYKNGKCTRCGKADPTHTHSYTASITTEPSCTEKGYTEYFCDCGESYIGNYKDALGHNYKNGKCTRCGKTDTNASSGTTSGNDGNGSTTVSFKDVAKTAWYKDAVDYAVSNGLMNGMGNNKFEPDTATNRAMLVTILWRYAGSPKEGTNTFKDVKSGQWFTEAVTWAAKNGIVTGVGNNKFDPEGKLTREQLATILFRYSKQLGLDTSARADFGKFVDGKKVQSWSKDAVQWAVAEGIIGGTSENGKLYLDPQGNATRAQVATILMRYISKINAGWHTYELVISNCSWWDAQKEAKARGGYLVNFNSVEEFNLVVSQIKTEGYQDVYFRIGGRRAEDSKKYYLTDADGKLFDDCLNADGAWCESLWLDGEPNFEWKGAKEAYMEIYYSEETGTWVWCDVANKPAYPTDASKLGYIIEYD